VNTASTLHAEAEVSSRPYIFVYADKRKVKIFTADILFAESERDYLKIVTKEKTIVVRQTMQEFEKQLPAGNFMRVHRSFLVNLDLVEAFDSGQLEVAGKFIPVGRQYRNEVMKRLDQ
jgi:DNA-binding LytR/AlgR family response regulator